MIFENVKQRIYKYEAIFKYGLDIQILLRI